MLATDSIVEFIRIMMGNNPSYLSMLVICGFSQIEIINEMDIDKYTKYKKVNESEKQGGGE